MPALIGKPQIEPYRLFFPLGLAYAVSGAGLWIAAAAHWLPYPAIWHRTLMIEGFELCFVVGFLLTALPGLTHARPATATEAGVAFSALVLFGVFALAGSPTLSHLAALTALLAVVTIAIRRLPESSQPPPEEFVHVGLGLSFGVVGTTLLVIERYLSVPPWPPRLPDHLLSVGMVLTLVLGVGSLLVPTFIGMRGPLEIPGVAKPHERMPRRAFHVFIAALLVAALAWEAMDAPVWGGRIRAVAATIVVLMAWKLHRGPGRADRSAWCMWSSGVFIIVGLWVAALGSRWTIAGLHLVFIGGFGLLTFAIATRVIVAHGKYGWQAEAKVLTTRVVVLLLIAIAARMTAELRPDRQLHWHALSGAAWVLACASWFLTAWPRIRRIGSPLLPPPA